MAYGRCFYVANNIQAEALRGDRLGALRKCSDRGRHAVQTETGEIQVLSIWKSVSVLSIAAVLVACGGGGDPTARGAIAVNTQNGRGAIVVNYTSQPEANSDSVDKCASESGAGCIVVLEFSDNGTCGSAAWSGGNKVWGVGSASSKEVADSRAMSDCLAKGGVSCEIPAWLGTQCN